MNKHAGQNNHAGWKNLENLINMQVEKFQRMANTKINKCTVVLIRDQTRSVAKQVSVAVGWVKIKISLMAQLKGLTAKFKLM